MESILEFMYLGVATFYQERMNDFLTVANSLEIKEISKNVEFDNEDVNNEEHEISKNGTNLEAEPQTNTIDDSTNSKPLIDYSQVQRTSDGVKYACSQCNYQAIRQSHLTSVKYSCN